MTDVNEQLPSADGRRHARRQYLQAVTIHVEDRTWRGMIQNMSASGVYIEADHTVALGQEVMISYPTSNNLGEIESPGRVVRIEAAGFAMEYI